MTYVCTFHDNCSHGTLTLKLERQVSNGGFTRVHSMWLSIFPPSSESHTRAQFQPHNGRSSLRLGASLMQKTVLSSMYTWHHHSQGSHVVFFFFQKEVLAAVTIIALLDILFCLERVQASVHTGIINKYQHYYLIRVPVTNKVCRCLLSALKFLLKNTSADLRWKFDLVLHLCNSQGQKH